MKRYAFLLMGTQYEPARHQAVFETQGQATYIRTVNSIDEALGLADWLLSEGIGAVELCGAFGAENAKELVRRTHGTVAVGYVVHEPEQDPLFARFFSHADEPRGEMRT